MSETANPCQTIQSSCANDLDVYGIGVTAEPVVADSPGETANPCQAVLCSNENDVNVYSTETLPPVEPVVVITSVGNDAITETPCGVGYYLDYYGNTPAGISVNRDTGVVTIAQNTVYADTKVKANQDAQAMLDAFIDGSTASGAMACISATCPTRTVAVAFTLGGVTALQSTWDAEHQLVWTSWNSGSQKTTKFDIAANTYTTITPSGQAYGVQYVPTTSGFLAPNGSLYRLHTSTMVSMSPVTPYSETTAVSGITGTASPFPLLYIPERNLMVGNVGVVASKLRYVTLDLLSNISFIGDTTAGLISGENIVYNPRREDIFMGSVGGAGGVDWVGKNLNSGTETSVNFGTYLTSVTMCGAYCPDNEYLYFPYLDPPNTYGCALVNANDYTDIRYATIGVVNAIKAIVYHAAKRQMYLFGVNQLSVIDITKYDDGDAMVVCSSPITTNGGGVTSASISHNSAVYCPQNRLVYLACAHGMLGFT